MRKLFRRLRPHWRVMTWVILLWNAVMAIWLGVGLATGANSVAHEATKAGQAGAEIGTGIGAALIIGVWVAGVVILGVIWLVTGYHQIRKHQHA